MKRLFLLSITCLFIQIHFHAQSFYNGSFETHSLSVCSATLNNIQFNSAMPHVTAFGNTYNGPFLVPGKISIQDSGCSVIPQHGNWCVGLRGNFDPTYDAIALELTSSLDSGATYYLSFYLYGNMGFQNFQLNVDLGESYTDSDFGKYIYSATPTYLAWKNISFSFVAAQSSNYITAKISSGYHSWNQLDNFVISRSPIPLGISEYASSDFFSLYPNPASSSLTLHFANASEPCLVELYNELGQPALPKQFVHEQVTELDLSALSLGIYHVRVTNSRTTVSRKLIIAR